MNYKLSLSPLFVLEIIASILFIVFFGFGNFLFFILLSMIFGAGFYWEFFGKICLSFKWVA